MAGHTLSDERPRRPSQLAANPMAGDRRTLTAGRNGSIWTLFFQGDSGQLLLQKSYPKMDDPRSRLHQPLGTRTLESEDDFGQTIRLDYPILLIGRYTKETEACAHQVTRPPLLLSVSRYLRKPSRIPAVSLTVLLSWHEQLPELLLPATHSALSLSPLRLSL